MTAFSGKGTVDPGGEATSSLTLGTVNSFSGTVDLSCQATSKETIPIFPTCVVSPASVAPPATATAIVNTVTNAGTATPGLYLVTVTGTSSAATPNTVTAQAYLTVQSVAPGFTITVQSAVVPSSVHAGSGGQGIISVNPLNGFFTPPGGGVTLSCSSITPLVTIPPICSFNRNPVSVNGAAATSTISISTFGPVPTGSLGHPGLARPPNPRGFAALWFPLPLLALAGAGAAVGGKRSRKAWGVLTLFVLGGTLLLLPGCGNNTSTTTTTPNGVTPKNAYTFTITGVDTLGNVSSNTGTGTTTSAPTVSLTVD